MESDGQMFMHWWIFHFHFCWLQHNIGWANANRYIKRFHTWLYKSPNNGQLHCLCTINCNPNISYHAKMICYLAWDNTCWIYVRMRHYYISDFVSMIKYCALVFHIALCFFSVALNSFWFVHNLYTHLLTGCSNEKNHSLIPAQLHSLSKCYVI